MDSPSEAGAPTRTRTRQQEVVADLGQRALETDDLDSLMHEACVAVAETLDNEYCKVLELLPDGDDVFLRQGVGWREGLVGSATVPTDLDSQAGYTLLSEEPVIVDDLRTEERFSGPELLTSHDVVSGVSVVIGSVEEPWGVLGTHTTERCEFTTHDANFVQSVANVLAAAIENERSRREREEILERVADGFFALDDEWRFTHVNERAAAILGRDADELLGRNVREAFPGAVDSGIYERYREAMTTQEPVSFERYSELLDVWVRVTVYPSETGLSVYFRDVTERKERERDLELFRTLVDHSTDSVTVIDPESGRYLDVNETGCRMRGYTREELLELTVPDVETRVPDLDAWRSEVEDMRAAGFLTFDGVHRRKDGTTYPVEVNASYVELDREYILAVTRDVTERRERERELAETVRELRESEERLRLALEAGEMGTWELDLQTEESPVRSPRHDRIFGYEEPLDDWDLATFLDHVHPDDRREVERRFEEAFETGRWEFECRIARVDGERRVISAQGEFFFDDDGEPVRAVGVVRDVTEHAERERRLEELVEKFEESNERLEQFAYAASHDLQEPLRMVSSYLQLLERRYGDDLDEDGVDFLDYAVDGADRMREMIQGLLQYSRVETQGDPFEPVDLDAVLANVRDDLQVKIAETDAEIVTESLPRVEGDANQLRQVFQNLLDNAMEYHGDEPPRIRVAAERNGKRWIVSVEDEGVGIPPEGRDRVFRVFQRLHAVDEHRGTGIGLALCQRIVERHGGEIWVDSEPGEGATFSFTLPAAGE